MTQNLIRSHIIYYGKNWKGKKYPFANLKSFWHLIWKNFCNLNCLWQYLKLRDKYCWRKSKFQNFFTFENGYTYFDISIFAMIEEITLGQLPLVKSPGSLDNHHRLLFLQFRKNFLESCQSLIWISRWRLS